MEKKEGRNGDRDGDWYWDRKNVQVSTHMSPIQDRRETKETDTKEVEDQDGNEVVEEVKSDS